MKKKMKRYGVLLTAMILVLLAAFPAWGDETVSAVPDLGKENTIEVTLKNSSGRIVTSGEFTLYLVANVKQEDGNLSYVYANGFENCGIELGDLNDGDLPKKLQEKISDNSWKNVQTVGQDGTAKFSGLKAGLYLIVNTRAAKRYYKVNPFLVSAPMQQDGKWIYEVDAGPKMEAAKPDEPDDDHDEPDEPEKPTKPETPTTPEVPTTQEVPPTTTVPGTGDEPENPENPECPDSPDEPDDPARRYGTPGGPGDTFVLDEKARKKLLAEQQGWPGGIVDAATLPKTGQLNWPVPVLAVSGMVVFSAGWVLKRGNRRDEK